MSIKQSDSSQFVPILPDGSPISVLSWSRGWRVTSADNSGSSIALLADAHTDYRIVDDWVKQSSSDYAVLTKWEPAMSMSKDVLVEENVPIHAAHAVHTGDWVDFGGNPGILDVENSTTKSLEIGWIARETASVIPAIHIHTKPVKVSPLDSSDLDEGMDFTRWTLAESLVFVERFLHYPKDFARIAKYLRRKNCSDCVGYYYTIKHKACLKQALRNFNSV